jgi:hypothetical protein
VFVFCDSSALICDNIVASLSHYPILVRKREIQFGGQYYNGNILRIHFRVFMLFMLYLMDLLCVFFFFLILNGLLSHK